MFSIRKPSKSQLDDFLHQHRDTPFTYADVEGTRGSAPQGFAVGCQRKLLGHGYDVFFKAKSSLQRWEMFPSEFVSLVWPGPIEVGRVVATLFYAPGFWTVNPCRIVYTIDDEARRRESTFERHGFAYGTIGHHVACGEERFTVERNLSDDSVWYEVYCFSRPAHWLAKLAYPYLRIQQHRFRTLSANAVQRAATTDADRVTEITESRGVR